MIDNLTITTTEPLIYGPAITFEPITLEAVTFVMLNEEYKLPAVKHQHFDALMSLCAVVIKLHQRVQELEAKLKGGNGD